ncbi:uncharacterized protein LOC143267142 [Peromyscus maniculatus bairdii]|uniref:uncharacterized protein LOC143267142 n=1 Tax=Peromyscus maniculatus bairdii TaxID=230844 RepID=UPI003FD019E7
METGEVGLGWMHFPGRTRSVVHAQPLSPLLTTHHGETEAARVIERLRTPSHNPAGHLDTCSIRGGVKTWELSLERLEEGGGAKSGALRPGSAWVQQSSRGRRAGPRVRWAQHPDTSHHRREEALCAASWRTNLVPQGNLLRS